MIQLPDFVLFLHKCLYDIAWRKNTRNVGKNITARHVLAFDDNIKKEWNPRKENISMEDRISNMEVQVHNLVRKFDEMASAINNMNH